MMKLKKQFSFIFYITFLHIVQQYFVSSERIAEKKCKEYAEHVYVNEAIPVLRIGAGTNNVSKCAIVEIPLIVGGVKAKPMEFPHMAVIGYGKEIFWQCGGTLISEQFVLTAAHCLDSMDKGPAIKVRFGLINLKQPGPTMQERNIVERIKHPDYKLPSKYNDIALIKLDKPLELNAEVRPACLEVNHLPPGKQAIASGFGKTSYDSSVGSDELMKVTLNHVETELCKKIFSVESGGIHLPRGIIPSMICAGVIEGGKDTCQGDSGGPLQRVLTNPYCTYSVIGVTSFGKFCAFKNSPAIYTRVSSYLDWIEKIVWPSG